MLLLTIVIKNGDSNSILARCKGSQQSRLRGGVEYDCLCAFHKPVVLDSEKNILQFSISGPSWKYKLCLIGSGVRYSVVIYYCME